MITLEEAKANIGRGVIYESYPGGPLEDGDITFVNDKYVFVLYVGDRKAKATRPEDLRWATT